MTGDILLADRCLKAGAAAVLAPNGRPFTPASIGARDRDAGDHGGPARRRGRRSGGGPAPFAKADRSRFLSALDEALVRAKRG